MIKLIIFDLDGVLVDSCDWHFMALNSALLEVCNFEISREDHDKTFNGLPTRKKLSILLKEGKILEDQVVDIENRKIEKTRELFSSNVTIDPDKISLMKNLVGRGYILACYSNCIKDTTYQTLVNLGIIDYFTYYLSNEGVINPKPHPEGYLKLMRIFNTTHKETLIIEDSEKGVEAARRSEANLLIVSNSKEVNLSLFEAYL